MERKAATDDRVKLLEEIAYLSRRVRQAQRDYFRTKEATTLRVAKDYERRLDKSLETLSAAPTLFDDPSE